MHAVTVHEFRFDFHGLLFFCFDDLRLCLILISVFLSPNKFLVSSKSVQLFLRYREFQDGGRRHVGFVLGAYLDRSRRVLGLARLRNP